MRPIRITLLSWVLPVLIGSGCWDESASVQPFPAKPPRATEASKRPPQRNVLVLNSYHQGFGWTDALVQSIASQLKEDPSGVVLWIEYLDSRRAGSEELLDLQERLIVEKYHGQPIDLIVTTDDSAILFLQKFHDRYFRGIPVVFCGVNDPAHVANLDRNLYTGVLEFFEVQSTLDLALSLHPKAREIVFVSDASVTGMLQRDAFMELARQRRDLSFSFLGGDRLTFEQILAKLAQLSPEAIVFTTAFTQAVQREYIDSYEATRRMTQVCPAPVYSPSTSDMGNGIVAGTENGGIHHGLLAAQLAARILHGESPSKLAVIEDRTVHHVFDARRLEELGIPESKIPPGSRIVNRDQSFFKLYQKWILLIGGFLLVQTLIILALVFNVWRRRRAELESAQRARELSETNRELAALNRSLEEEVSRRREAENDLRESQVSLHRAQRIARLGSWEYLPDSGSIHFSDEVARIFDLSPEATLTDPLHFRRYIDPESMQRLAVAVNAALNEEQPYDIEYQIVLPNQRIRYLREQGELSHDGGQPRLVGTIQDLTELRQVEEQLRQAQKLESVGRLAGGVAHDFNNMLTVILGYTELIQATCPAEAGILEQIQEIERAAIHSRETTKQLLAFSRKQIIAPIRIVLNQQIQQTQSALARLIGEDIQLTFIPGNSLWGIKLDPTQVEQVLVNLAVNARDAMPDGGSLTVETANVVIDRAYCDDHPESSPGEYVLLAVSDNGVGMGKDVITHVFEPFFTTKPLGEGTGLGMATVYGIVKQNGGFINVYSEPGLGTTFRIYFPRFEDTSSPTKPEETRRERLVGSGTILLVEDEAIVRRTTSQMLQAIGFRVVAAESPGVALTLCRQETGPIDLLMTDVIMPQMNGMELSQRIRELRPEIKVLFTSGYTPNVIVKHGVLEPGVEFIPKPFTLNDLVECLRNVLP